ncbi:hypothetical protein BDW02DRAFT_615545 [Decorospora gaudefroyi]|uniref:Transmembrane protein n=1 Tax=Decorospora gaudefroyi TaxID=184978 RepID=A0A6A5KPN0_9PLEO|nr:hypothetical protein BDW02DRAFT_615545 [Decorospora gaudefroyi]
MVSYDECGVSVKNDGFRRVYRRMRRQANFDNDIRYIYEEAAFSLAGDRQTRILPVVLSEILFIGGWVISLVKAASSEPGPTNWVNVEAQSIAISALFLWVTATVVIGSLIGASQTEDMVPRILHTMENDLGSFQGRNDRRPSTRERVETVWCPRSVHRARTGGTYSWRPDKWKGTRTKLGVSRAAVFASSLVAVIVVGISFSVAALLSYLVAPQGFSCRHIPETIVFAIWLLSFAVETVCEIYLGRRLFWTIFWKDALSALSIVAIILLIQWGIMNRCSCWSRWGSTGLHLPQMTGLKGNLMHFIRHVAPWIVLAAIVLHLRLCVAVVWKYWDAFRVFIQRDDGASNLGWERSGR